MPFSSRFSYIFADKTCKSRTLSPQSLFFYRKVMKKKNLSQSLRNCFKENNYIMLYKNISIEISYRNLCSDRMRAKSKLTGSSRLVGIKKYYLGKVLNRRRKIRWHGVLSSHSMKLNRDKITWLRYQQRQLTQNNRDKQGDQGKQR